MQAKWIGRPVREHENCFDEIRNVIPCFDRQPFTADGVENDHLDMIIKRPVDTHDNRVPVATVSIGKAGAKNAGYLAAQILGVADDALAAGLRAERERMAADVLRRNDALQEKLRGR